MEKKTRTFGANHAEMQDHVDMYILTLNATERPPHNLILFSKFSL